MPLWQPIDSILNQIIWLKFCSILSKVKKLKSFFRQFYCGKFKKSI
jgi:hypothetical protein